MMKWFEKLNQLSLPAILFIASSLTIASVLPLWLYATSQQTRTSTRAVGTLNTPTPTPPTPTEGPVPSQPPVISRVYPWVGKPGDSVVIEGAHFGSFPKNRRLAIGDALLTDTDITSWSDTQIEAIIPQQAKQGGTVQLRIDTYPMTESAPLTLYDRSVQLKLRKTGNSVSLSGLKAPIQATLWTTIGRRQASATPGVDPAPLFTLGPGESIISIILSDTQGNPMSYSINPTEFGF